MDYRSDFYALGITLYELLTGRLPFVSDDALELVHSHIARPPAPPQTLRPDLPDVVSAIIMKLLAKDANERYQSAYGLLHDLEQTIQQLDTSGTIAPFPIAQRDVSDRFALPQQLYGRQNELAVLLGTFDQVAAGSSALLLIAGPPGIGKTALVQEIYRPLTERRGAFISGKFDQVQRSIPYLAFAQAFRGLMRHLLTEPETVLQQWRERIIEAVGVNGQVISEVIPDLALVIGEQPPLPELGPQETQNRFMRFFQQFLKVFTRPEHPLVLFVDDLQWADSGSLKLLVQLLSGADTGHLFLIGAYRDTEVPPDHLLWATLETIRQAGVSPQTLTLGRLDAAAVSLFTQKTLHVDAFRAQPLAQLLLSKTGGNPFFLGEFLKALYVEEFLSFVPAQACWVWEQAQVEARQMTDNVVQLMLEQVQRLPAASQPVLQSAACIGNRFDLHTLAAVLEQSSIETAYQLEPALLAGLIEPLGESYKVAAVEIAGMHKAVQAEYHFVHDRVQQAAYEQVAGDARATRHWQIGRLLLANTPDEERDERLFAIVNQLNAGRALANETERLELAQLNLEAGRKARESAAFAAAYALFHVGLDLLPADAWDAQYALALALHNATAEAAYLSGDFDAMERLADIVLTQAREAVDTVPVYETRLEAATTQGRLDDAVTIGLLGLKQLEIRLPATPQPAEVTQAVQELHRLMQQHPPEHLLELPSMKDPKQLAAIQLLMRLFGSCYIAAPALVPIIAAEAVALSIRHGNAPGSSFAYATAGAILCHVVGDIETGYECGLLAVRLVERVQSSPFKARVYMGFHCHIRNWKDALRSSVQHLLNNYQVALETGDYLYLGGSTVLGHLVALYAGWYLDDLEHSVAQYHQALIRLKDHLNGTQMSQLWQVIADLQAGAAQPGILQGAFFDETVMIAHYQAVGDGSSIACLAMHKLILAYLFAQTTRFHDCISLAETHVAYLTANPSLVPINMYASLARLRLYPDAPAEEQAALLEKVEANQQQLAHWATHAPMNYLHKWQLVEAERCRVLGQRAQAWEHYQQAIDGAREHEFIQEEALAHELLGRFLLEQGQPRMAQVALHDAYYAYGRWGASAKVQHLEQQYHDLFIQRDDRLTLLPPVTTLRHAPDPSTTSSSTGTSALDVASHRQSLPGHLRRSVPGALARPPAPYPAGECRCRTWCVAAQPERPVVGRGRRAQWYQPHRSAAYPPWSRPTCPSTSSAMC
ncbi:MAG: AAA family ATPase, partial [Chloroflexaceae bacterium]|nr:AAA family ATPase [Chloroflexaceae bacterium]